MPVLQAFSELPVVEHTLGGGDTPRGGGGMSRSNYGISVLPASTTSTALFCIILPTSERHVDIEYSN